MRYRARDDIVSAFPVASHGFREGFASDVEGVYAGTAVEIYDALRSCREKPFREPPHAVSEVAENAAHLVGQRRGADCRYP